MSALELTEGMKRALDGMRSIPPERRRGRIEGVMVKTLTKHSDERGYLIEQLKRGDCDDEGRLFMPDQPFAQMSRSLCYAHGGNLPGPIKAFHWHLRQWDYWDVIGGNVRAVLVDAREDSATVGITQVVMLGEDSPRVLAIPPQVLHGFQAVDLRDVMLNYYVTEPYRPEAPDEGRVPWDDQRIAFDWRVASI